MYNLTHETEEKYNQIVIATMANCVGAGSRNKNKIVFNSNNFQFVNNLYYYPMNGNIIYYLYNNFYINYSNIHPPSSSDVEDEKFEKDVHTTKKEEEIQN